MSINLCGDDLETTIESSCVMADGFEVYNLLKEQHLNQGFQAERFTRCPVFILLKFAIPIELHQVVIQPWLGKQCEKVVQVYTYQTSLNAVKELKFDDVRFKAGSATLSKPNELVFTNKRYKNYPNFKILPQPKNAQQKLCILKGQFDHVTAIKIGLHVMLNGSIPSIRLLKVFGKPSPRCNKTKADNFLLKWKNKFKISEKQSASSSNSTNLEEPQKMPQTDLIEFSDDTVKRDSTPDIFMDPITCSKMTNPILLPSGHTIDHKTLDKHIITQEERGGLPSDPFTGILFTEFHKPIPNVSLKQKLDQFTMGMSSTQENVKKRPPSPTEYEFSSSKKLKNSNQLINKNTKSGLDDSLEVSLNKAKEKNLSFRTIHLNNNTWENSLHCGLCGVYLTFNAPQYRLPCDHKFCRKCSLGLGSSSESSNLKCSICKKEFAYSDMNRVHIEMK